MLRTFKNKNILAPSKTGLLLGIICWLMFEVGFPLLLIDVFDIENAGQMYWFQIANFCAAFILTAVCFMSFLKDSIANTRFDGFGKSLLMGYGLYMALSFAVGLIISVLDMIYRAPTANVNQELVEQLLNQKSLPMILCTVALAPITEECLVRGVLFAPLCKYKPWLAYAVSAAVFALLHVVASIGTASAVGMIENFMTYLPSGIVLGWMYQRTGTVIGPIALHSLSNLLSVLTILWAL